MNTEEIKTFVVLSKVKNFTLAAEQMFIAQSTVTNRIGELEKEVGKKLFFRGSKTATLTEEGKIFLKFAERMLELQETSIAEMNAVSAYSYNFAIGAINATYEGCVKPIVDGCLKNATDTSVKVMLGRSLDLVQQLQDNVLDIVFSSVPWKRAGYECEIFDTDRLLLVTGKGENDYPDGVTKEKIAKLPYLLCDFSMSEPGRFVRSLFPENHAFRLEVDNSSKLLPYLKGGIGYSFLPYKAVKKELETGILEEVPLIGLTPPPFITYMIYRQGYSPAEFLKFAKPEQ